MINQRNKKGFVLLFAVLLVSIVLTVTLVLLDITLRQLVLSATNRDSQKAYYAAYSGIDCVIYWDRDATDGTYWPFGKYDAAPVLPGGTGSIECSKAQSDPTAANPSIFKIAFDDGSCARVEVTKAIPVGGNGDTIIVSNGYNLGDEDDCPNVSSNRLVERTLSTTYNDNW